MSNVQFTNIIIIHKTGSKIFQHGVVPDLQLDTAFFFSGFFAPLIPVLIQFRNLGLYDEVGKIVELWPNVHTCCCVVKNDLFITVSFTVFTQRTIDSIAQMKDQIEKINKKFNEKYHATLAQWDQNLSHFKEFTSDLQEILES
jgi:hypothetical protein